MVRLSKTAAGMEQTLSPEQAREMYEKALRTQEEREDKAYEERQKRKLQKDMKIKKKDPMLEPGAPRGHTDEQQRAIEEFMKKQREEPTPEEPATPEPKPDKPKLKEAPPELDKALQGLMSDPEVVQQPPPGGWRCMSPDHQEEKAVLKIKHNGILGADVGDLFFCEDCAYHFKFIPVEGEKEEEIKRWIGASRKLVIDKLAKLANQCDKKGLHEEADSLDALIQAYISE